MVRGRDLIGKVIVSEENGSKFGDVADVSFVGETGELMNVLLTNPTKKGDEVKLEEDGKGRQMVPFTAVKSIGDFVIVSEEEIV